MRRLDSRLRKVDVFAAAESRSGYIGTKITPELLGYVYADVRQQPGKLDDRREGVEEKQSARLFMRPDAGVKCGDLVALYGSAPDSRITEVKRGRDYAAATAVRI